MLSASKVCIHVRQSAVTARSYPFEDKKPCLNSLSLMDFHSKYIFFQVNTQRDTTNSTFMPLSGPHLGFKLMTQHKYNQQFIQALKQAKSRPQLYGLTYTAKVSKNARVSNILRASFQESETQQNLYRMKFEMCIHVLCTG